MRRARRMGLRTRRRPMTPTARLAAPRETMTEASSWLMPSRVKTAPRALLKRGLSSSWATAWVAMARAEGDLAPVMKAFVAEICACKLVRTW